MSDSSLNKIEESFLDNHTSNEALSKAVIEQMGGFESFSESASDISNHGIDGGFGGFITYHDTVSFAQDNREVIIEALKSDSQDFGHDSVPEMMSNWRSLDGISQDEISEALYSNNENLESHTQVYNAMAWYAGEKVANEYAGVQDELSRDFATETVFDSVNELISSEHQLGKDQQNFLKNLDDYVDSAGLEVSSAEYKEVGNVEITLTNYKAEDGGFREDVNLVVGKEQVQVETQDGLTQHNLADLNVDFSAFKNQVDAEMRDQYTLSILGQDNHLVKTSVYESEQAIDGMLNIKNAQEVVLSVNGEQVAVKNSDFLAVDSGHGDLTNAFESKGANVVALDEVQDFKSLVAEHQSQKDVAPQKDNGIELG